MTPLLITKLVPIANRLFSRYHWCMFSVATIKEMVEKDIPHSTAQVVDMTGTNDHFQLSVISNIFEGKSSVERHQMVYKVLGSFIGGEIHALSLKTMTPTEAGGK